MVSIFDSDVFNANLFFPRADTSLSRDDADEYYIDAPHGIRIHVRRHPNPGSKVSLLFFHGNGEIVADYDNLAGLFSNIDEMTFFPRGYRYLGFVYIL